MYCRLLTTLAVVLIFCSSVKSQRLPHSYANVDDCKVKHLHLDLLVDFDSQQLVGSAELTLERSVECKWVSLDTKGLQIASVSTVGPSPSLPLDFDVGKVQGVLGRKLTVYLPDGVDRIKIEYSTSPGAEALQWLTPEQTTDKQHPFLFTQSQAILARTWVPCQDTPAVRMTYSAEIEVPSHLLAVMSAANPQERSASGEYWFEMKQPIPSYLLALAVGDLEFVEISERSGVYAEPSVIKKAAWELADTERMIFEAEKLYGPYQWDRYDVIFLPASFPFGGMENPRLTFATPTILAGDRSLVALIAHELAHSWSGNLVTNATWNDFWLNEGFTVYFEQRIMEAVFGRPYSEMLAKLSLDGLKDELKDLDRRDSWLKLDLQDRNPDDGMTAVAYDKGYFFLRMMEERIGRQKWDTFLKNYFTRHAFQSMTTEGFVDYLNSNLVHDAKIEEWIYGPGLPPDCPVVQTEALSQVEQDAKAFLAGHAPETIRTQDYTTHHWLHFLRSLEMPMTSDQMKSLDAAFELTQSGNAEITHDWMLHVIASSYEPGMGRLEEFLTQQGRRKFLTPLYRKLLETQSGTALAKAIYQKARPTYHAVSRQTIDALLKD